MRRAFSRLLRRVADAADPPIEQTAIARDTQSRQSRTNENDNQTAQKVAYSVSIEFKVPESVIHEYRFDQTKKHRLEKLSVGLLALTAIIVATYTIVTYRQWQEMKASVEISRKALDSNERAWLITELDEFKLADKAGVPAFSVRVKNAGKSPAWAIRHVVECRFDADQPKIVRDPWPIDLTISPSAERRRTLKCWSIASKEAAEMHRGTREFWFWILTLYRDPFTTQDRRSLECWHRFAGPGQTLEPCGIGSNRYE